MPIVITSNRMPTRGQKQKCSHVYFLLIVAMVLLLWPHFVLLWHQVTMVTSQQHLYHIIVHFDKTIVLPRKRATGSKHEYLFCYGPLVGILFEALINLTRFYNYQSFMCTKRQILNNFYDCWNYRVFYCQNQPCGLKGNAYLYHLFTRCEHAFIKMYNSMGRFSLVA